MNTPVRYSPSVEQPKPDEQETIAKLDEQFRDIQNTTAADYGHGVRAVHAKAHGIARGTLTVTEGLPPELAQGLFARGGRYEAIIRISTQPGDILDDSVNSPRGIALKLRGVEGERLPGSEGDTTQDFIGVNGPVFGAPDTKKFLGNLTMLAKTTDKMEGVKKMMSAVLQPIEAGLEAIGMPSPNLQQMGGAAPVHPRHLGAAHPAVPRPGEAAGRGRHRRVEAGGQSVPHRRDAGSGTADRLDAAGVDRDRGSAGLQHLARARRPPAVGQHQPRAP